MPNFSGVNFGKIRKAVKFPVEFPVESKSGRIHSKVSGTGVSITPVLTAFYALPIYTKHIFFSKNNNVAYQNR